MAIKLSDLFGSMDEAFNNPKLEEMFKMLIKDMERR